MVQYQGSDQACPAIWLGDASLALDAAWSRLDVHHVCTPRALMRALEHGVAPCVIVDTTLPGLDPDALVKHIRHRWPHISLLALIDVPPGAPLVKVPWSGFDHYLRRDVDADDLETTVRYLVANALRHPSGNDYHTLQDRTRHLEELVRASFTLSGALDSGQIVGDLREVGRMAVDADDLAVLIVDGEQSDFYDALNLGVPGRFLEVCRNHLRNLPADERVAYLTDEVLLRDRSPDLPRMAPRVREAEAAGARSYMRLPLSIDQRPIGFLALFSAEPNRFNGVHLQLGRLLATQVATAVRNMRLFVRLNQAEERQRAVSRVAHLIAEDLALDTVLERIVEEAALLVGGQAGMVLLTQPDRSLVVGAVYNHSPDLIGRRIEPGNGQVGVVALTGRPNVIANYDEWEHVNPDQRETVPLDVVLFGVPLIYRGLLLGVLQIIRDKTLPGDIREVQDVLMMLAPQAATAIAKAQLHQTVDQDRLHLQAILEHTPAAVVVCDAEGRVQLVNPEAEKSLRRLLDMPIEAVKGQRVVDLVREWLSDEELNVSEFKNTVEVSLGSAGEFVVHIAPIVGSDGTVDGYVGVGQDVTELRRMDRMKSNLTRVLTHDLGNLLMLARSPIELLQEPNLTPVERETLRNMLIGSLERMEVLIRDVTDLEMAGSLGHDTMVQYVLHALVEQAVNRHQDEARGRQIRLAFRENNRLNRPLEGHAVLILQAIDNLVSNAVKYTPPGGRVDVSCGVEGEYAVVRVRDTGYGIPADKLSEIFEPFVRIRNRRTMNVQGTGLGLSLVKAFVEAHGGYVTVESELDVGSEFAIFLPLKGVEAARTVQNHVTHLDLSRLAEARGKQHRV